MESLSLLPLHEPPVAAGGPTWPARSTLLISWWLLREIEASRARKKHITVDSTIKKITWMLPSSKTDQAALGAERSHTCSCEFSRPSLCPYHLIVAHLQGVRDDNDYVFTTDDAQQTTKRGWADTFQQLATQLQLPVQAANGARLYTGHSARVSGARHMASSQIELWRIQLFGRWGSEVFLHYIQDAPLAQLNLLAQEVTAQQSLQNAKAELAALLRAAAAAGPAIALPAPQMLEDCEAAAERLEDPPLSSSEFIRNSNGGGKVHRVLDKDELQHPRNWRTRCGWHFARDHTHHSWLSAAEVENVTSKSKCHKCFPELAARPSSSSSSSDSSDTSLS